MEVELAKPAEGESVAEDVVSKLLRSSGFVVDEYWSGSRCKLVEAPGADSRAPTTHITVSCLAETARIVYTTHLLCLRSLPGIGLQYRQR